MSEEKKFFLESLQDRETICKYLDALKEGFQQGRINLSSNEQTLDIVPSGLIKFTIKGKRKDGEIKLNLRFRWADDDNLTDFDESWNDKMENDSRDG
ncbi:amphi-Trp domain-containing protein [Desulfonatronospira sp.]|uniref:amphi-Trp domain-containing protein n=1 Tax=Desulfonatronospira sp. TaxID=1962951 RepID=UPI0025B81BBB|nr:amphi-Trp domain-containing protein [Desulfonatronospira sp.]